MVSTYIDLIDLHINTSCAPLSDNSVSIRITSPKIFGHVDIVGRPETLKKLAKEINKHLEVLERERF